MRANGRRPETLGQQEQERERRFIAPTKRSRTFMNRVFAAAQCTVHILIIIDPHWALCLPPTRPALFDFGNLISLLLDQPFQARYDSALRMPKG